MKKLILFISSFALIGTGFAQQASFGLKGGLNVSNIASDNDVQLDNGYSLDDPSSRVGFHAGVTLDLKLTDMFGIGAEALYSQQGTQDEGTIAGVDYENVFKVNYLNVPILAKLYLGKTFNIYGGIQPGFVVSAKQVNTIGGNETEYDLKKDGDGDNKFGVVKDTDFGFPVGIGFRPANGLLLDARYIIGANAVFEGQDDDSNEVGKNRVLQVSIGFML